MPEPPGSVIAGFAWFAPVHPPVTQAQCPGVRLRLYWKLKRAQKSRGGSLTAVLRRFECFGRGDTDRSTAMLYGGTHADDRRG